MMKFFKTAALASCVLIGQQAAAEEHELLILRYGYYPEVLYVQPGDTIRFINESPNWARVYSNDPYDNYNNYTGNCDTNTFSGSQDGWATNWIPRYGSRTITVTACMEDEIEAPYIWQYTRYNSYNEAWISFSNPPNG